MAEAQHAWAVSVRIGADMLADILRSSVAITHVPSMFSLTHYTMWKAVCLRCGSTVCESRELSEIKRAETLHRCDPSEIRPAMSQ